MALTPRNVFRKYVTDGVPGSGPHNVRKDDAIELFEQMIGGTAAIGDYQGAWDNSEDYIARDFVEYGGSLWKALVDNTGVTPVEGATWTLLLPGVTVADATVTLVKLADETAQAFAASVPTYAALRALSKTRYTTALVTDAKRGGNFERSNADLSATLSNLSVTSTAVDSSTDIVTKTAHGMATGDAVIATTTVNGLALNTVYYVINLSSSTFALATSLANARAGTKFNLTGTTNFTVKRLIDPLQGVYVIATGDALDGSNGAWVRRWSVTADVFWWGAVGDGVADDTAAIQFAANCVLGLWFSNSTYKITDTIYLRDYANLYFVSHQAIILGDLAKPLLAANDNGTANRHFFIAINGGMIDGVDSTGGSIAIDLSNVTYGRVTGTFMRNCAFGIILGGITSAYYNVIEKYIISDCTVGIKASTLGNSNMITLGSIKNCAVAFDCDDNTDNSFDKNQGEGFTGFGVRVSNTALATVMARAMFNRFENPSKTGLYSSAVAVRFAPAAVSCCALYNYISVVTTGVSDSGSSSSVTGNTVP